MRAIRFSFLFALLLAGPLLGGCSSNFDPTDALDKLDFFNLNKEEKLKGERKPLFPEGVPGVAQGIPPELVKGYKPAEVATVPEEPAEKPKPKPRVVNRTPAKPTRVQVSPAPAQQQPQQAQRQPPPAQQQSGAQSPWPAQQPQQQQQTSPWPDAPAPNTFQR